MLGRPNESSTNVVVCLVGDHSLDIGSRWNSLCYPKTNQRISDGTVLYTHDRTNITSHHIFSNIIRHKGFKHATSLYIEIFHASI